MFAMELGFHVTPALMQPLPPVQKPCTPAHAINGTTYGRSPADHRRVSRVI